MALKNTQNHESKPLTSSAVTTLQIPGGGKIHNIMVLFTTSAGAVVTEAQIRAEIANIRLTFNGRDIINASPILLLDMYEALSVHVGTPAAVPGVLELNIGRLLFNNPEVKDLFGFGTADVANIQVAVTAGTLSAIANVQTITARTPQIENLGAHCEFINYPRSYNAAAQDTVDTLPRNTDSSYLALLIDDGASGTISSSEVRVNNYAIRENLNASINNLFLSNNGYAQPPGYFVHGFADGGLDGRLPMPGVTDLRVLTTFSVAPGAGGYNIAALTLVTPAKTA